MGCLIHKWNGCKCTRCGKRRDKLHDWNGCKCSRCGWIRDEQHDWDLCKGVCKRCGKKQEQQHDWDGCKCTRCGKVREEQHDWDGCKCKRCGKVREEGHNYIVTLGKCEERCTICGAVKERPHVFAPTSRTCEEKCEVCGTVRINHTYVDGVCKKCRARDEDTVMNRCLSQLLSIFPSSQLTASEHVEFNNKYGGLVRAIGNDLDRLGGMRCMRKVGMAFAQQMPIHARKLETMWDGIGYWMG